MKDVQFVSVGRTADLDAVADLRSERSRSTSIGRSLDDFGDVLTVEEAASVLRISRASAYQAARAWRRTRRDGLPVVQIGRRLLVPRAAIEALLADVIEPDVDSRSPSDL